MIVIMMLTRMITRIGDDEDKRVDYVENVAADDVVNDEDCDKDEDGDDKYVEDGEDVDDDHDHEDK